MKNGDNKLFYKVKHGDSRAFEELFKKFYSGLCDYCNTILGDLHQSEDVVQELFANIWINREKIKLTGNVDSYLYSSVRNRAFDVLRHQLVRHKNGDELIEYLKEIASEKISDEQERRIEIIKKEIEKLPEQCRQVFRMSCLEGKKYSDIAQVLDISVNTVKSHIKKAYSDIRQKLNS